MFRRDADALFQALPLVFAKLRGFRRVGDGLREPFPGLLHDVTEFVFEYHGPRQDSLPSPDHHGIHVNQRDRSQGLGMKLSNFFDHLLRGFLRSDAAHPRAHAGNGEGDKALLIGQPERGSRGQFHVFDGNAHGRFGHGRRVNDCRKAGAAARGQHGLPYGYRRLSPSLVFHD